MPASTTGRPAAVMSILVTANTRSAQANLAALDRQMAYSVRRAGAGSVLLQRAAAGLRFAGVGMAAGLAGSVAAAAGFENAFANVRKTVAATRPQFSRLREDILDLSTQIPESASSLAELAGEAGALGVKQKDLIAFTKTASQLGTATQMTSQAAADGLARLANRMDEPTSKVRRMGSVLVDLGNKGASTEADILEMSKRIAGSGKQVGLTTAQVEGMAAGLSNLGIRAEMGGSAISRVMLAMEAAIATGGPELKQWADVAGTSVQEFAEVFGKDPTDSIALFAEGLGKVKEDGGSAAIALEGLGTAAHTSMNEIRVRDTLLSLASNTDEFTDSLDIANQEWRQNNALSTEAHRKYQTLTSQVELLKNSIVRMGIDFGTELLPTIKETVQLLRDPELTLDEKMGVLFDQMGELIEDAAPMVAEAGGKLGVALVKGLGTGFLEGDFLTKIFTGAALTRMFLGPGAFRTVGTTLGTRLGSSMANSATGQFTTQLANGGGVMVRGVERQTFWERSRLGRGLATGGRMLGGSILATSIIGGVMGGLRDPGTTGGLDKELGNRLQNVFSGATLGIVPSVEGQSSKWVEAFTADIPQGLHEVARQAVSTREATAALNKKQEILNGLYQDGKLTAEDYAAATAAVEDAQKEVRIEADRTELEESFKGRFDLKDIAFQFKSNMAEIKNDYAGDSESIRALSKTNKNELAQHIRGLIDSEEISLRQGGKILNRFGLDLRDLGPEFRRFKGTASSTFHDTVTRSEQMKNQVGANYGEMTNTAITALHSLEGSTNSSLGALNADEVNFGINSAKAAEGKGFSAFHDRAGGMHSVPGVGSGDKVPVHMGGQLVGLVEPGERVGVMNARASAVLNAWNRDIPRFGPARLAKGGGLSMALGPYDIPPIQYDPNHAGGNSHVHISMTSPGAAQAMAGRIKPMGWTASEAPWAGGLTVAHQDPGHATGAAFDANTAADETRDEVAALARVLGGSGVGGAAAVQKLKRILIKGPGGGLRNLAQGASDKVWKAANKYLAKKGKTSMPMEGSAGPYDKSKLMKLWKSVNPGIGSPSLMAAIALAESSGDPMAHGPPDGRGLWQIEWPLWSGQLSKFGNPYQAGPNARMAREVLNQQGLNAWVVYNTGAYRHFMRQGGVLPSLDRGGKVTRSGVAEVHKGDNVRMGKPTIELHFHGSAKAALATLDDVYAIVDGERIEIDSHQRNRGRHARPRRGAAT